MKFIALKTKDGDLKGDIAFFCRVLHVSRQGFYQYLANKDCPWKYQPLADAMKEILTEDECNDTYGRIRMYQALTLKQPENVNWHGKAAHQTLFFLFGGLPLTSGTIYKMCF